MDNNFKQERENIVSVFKVAKRDLQNLNVEIKNSMDSNAAQIKQLRDSNKEMKRLKSSNRFSIWFFSLFFKV
jgi:hypothetical protein